MIEAFREILADRNRPIREAREKGRRVVGWGCTYIPEEILHAAGTLPVRVLGGRGETPLGDARLYSNVCSFVRSCLDQALQGHYDGLDGFVTVNACDPIRRLYDAWSYYLKTPYVSIFSLPSDASDEAIDFFRLELLRLADELKRTLGIRVTEAALRRSIRLYNRSRELLGQLYQTRATDPPPLSGSEMLEVVLAGMLIPREHFCDLLEELLARLTSAAPKERPGSPLSDRVRLLLMGSELDDPRYVQLIEEAGGVVVADDLCMGSRYFSGLVDEAAVDPFEALARRYLTRPPCPKLMYPAAERIAHLQRMARQYRVEGVIHQSIKFCDNHAGVYTVVRHGFEEMDLPILELEREYALSGAGQLKTRVQAFVESLLHEV